MYQPCELYQLKIDVGMLNTVKIYWADVSSVNPSSEQKKPFCSDEGLIMLEKYPLSTYHKLKENI